MPGKTCRGSCFSQKIATRASMRPQRNAGENEISEEDMALNLAASMRPQRNAGENGIFPVGDVPRQKGFNEAPAKCRGKRFALPSS